MKDFFGRWFVDHRKMKANLIVDLFSDVRRYRDKLGKRWFYFLLAIAVAVMFRVAVAHWLPNDAPDDGRVYAQIARNIQDHHVYSHEAEPPYSPSLIRLPGYPLFLSGIYGFLKLHGGNFDNGVVRFLQALIDAATCGLIALLAFYWQPDVTRKHASTLAALELAAVCPFTTIYVATILTEVPTKFLIMAMLVAATLAFRKSTTEGNPNRKFKRALLWWFLAGLLGGLAVLFRPDNGLFVAAVGITLVVTAFTGTTSNGLLFRGKEAAEVETLNSTSKDRRFTLPAQSKIFQTFAAGAVFSLAFALVLTPWTIRNWRVFHVFQPLAPAHAEMPGEFVPRGYNLWVRTWVNDDRYIGPFLWSLDSAAIDIDDAPPSAFDSADERSRVAALLEKYNHPDASEESSDDQSNDQDSDDENADQSEEPQTEEPASPEMTPEIDAAFGQLARERIARHPFRYYVWLPVQRARTMWFDTHSQYWPFEGALLPLEDLDHEHRQHLWLPLFATLTAIYTILGLAGGWVLWQAGKFSARRWLLLVSLAILFRLVLFSSMENPEPRYFVEFFPFLSILGGIAIARIPKLLQNRER